MKTLNFGPLSRLLKPIFVAATVFTIFAGAAHANSCEIIPSVALTYGDYSLYREDSIAIHNKWNTDSKLGTLAHANGVITKVLGDWVDITECFSIAIYQAKELPLVVDMTWTDLLEAGLLPFSNNAMALPFVSWKFVDGNGKLFSGQVNAATDSILKAPRAGDQRVHEDGSPLIRK